MTKEEHQTPYYTIEGIIQRGLPVLVVTCIMSILVGQILNSREEHLISMPAILILIPSLIKIGGDTGSMLGARLSSISVSILVFLASNLFGFGMPLLTLLQISLIAVAIELTVVYSATVAIAFASHRFGIDPDDTVIPFIASLGDLVGVAGILTALHLLNIL